MDYMKTFKAARKASAPIVILHCTDPNAVYRDMIGLTTEGELVPQLQWDICRGVIGLNRPGELAAQAINGGPESIPAVATGNPVNALDKAMALMPENAILFMLNAHRFIEGFDDSPKLVIQSIWNCRDQFKQNTRTLVLLVPSMKVPDELVNDVVTIDVPLPDDAALKKIVEAQYQTAGLALPENDVSEKAVAAVCGLNAFAAEQVTAMSITSKGLNLVQLWERKRTVIEQTAGLQVYRGAEKFSDLGGLFNMKDFMMKIINGAKRPRLFVFIDEIEKALAGAARDTSGTSQDQVMVLLRSMQDYRWTGVILLGFSGTGKSAFSKACGNEAGVPTVEADLGAMKGSLVGESERMMRGFIKTIRAMGQSEVFFIATCNQIAALSPELKRRFRKGIFFCDLPASKERMVIWKMYCEKFGIEFGNLPDDDGWTGAEIEVCCENAAEFGCTLKEAARFVTIASKAMGDGVEALRAGASGKYINADAPGFYQHKAKTFNPNAQRKIGDGQAGDN